MKKEFVILAFDEKQSLQWIFFFFCIKTYFLLMWSWKLPFEKAGKTKECTHPQCYHILPPLKIHPISTQTTTSGDSKLMRVYVAEQVSGKSSCMAHAAYKWTYIIRPKYKKKKTICTHGWKWSVNQLILRNYQNRTAQFNSPAEESNNSMIPWIYRQLWWNLFFVRSV